MVRGGDYIYIKLQKTLKNPWDKFKKTLKRTLRLELFLGLYVVFREMAKRGNTHTVQYPLEKMPLSPRYRAVHRLLRFANSAQERCIGCGLCEKICISNCIRMDTGVGKDGRKEISEFTINFGRCIYCGFCAEVCPELAIVHGYEYENATEQRAQWAGKEDMLTPIDDIKNKKQKEYPGFGALSKNADDLVVKTPLAY